MNTVLCCLCLIFSVSAVLKCIKETKNETKNIFGKADASKYWVPIYIYRTFINLFLALFLGKTELGAFIFYTALHI